MELSTLGAGTMMRSKPAEKRCLLSKDKYEIPKTVRMPSSLYKHLEDEADYTGIGQPAVMARTILVERLRNNDLSNLQKIVNDKLHIPLDSPKINIRLSERLVELSNQAAEIVSEGEFSRLIQAILIERYTISS